MARTKELLRADLEHQLEQIWDKPLTVITAPSGYGKTTLLTGYLEKKEYTTQIYLSLGRDAVDEVWVWTKLCAKCSVYSEGMAEELSEIGLPESSQEVEYVKSIVEKYVRRPTCLVIDDFEECKSRNINRVITNLAYDGIKDLHIVIVSRTYPDIPCEELFLRGCCIMIDKTELALSRRETEEVFAINGVKLSTAESDAVYEYTDGWISAVYLALYDYLRNGRVGAFTSAHHLLKTAIFDKLTPTLQNIYTKLSPFDSFTCEAAAYVAEEDILPAALLEVMDAYGFLRYDAKTQRYSMHSLLRAVAGQELIRRGLDKNYLYNRGAVWCEQNGDEAQAVLNYNSAGNNEAILRLLSGNARHIVFESMPVILQKIFTQIPMEQKKLYPVAWLGYIYDVTVRIGKKKSIPLYTEACAAYEGVETDGSGVLKLQGELEFIGSMLEFNDIEKTNARMKEAYELLENRPSRIFRQTLMNYGVPFMTQLYYRRAGQLARTIELEKEYARYYMRLVDSGSGHWDELFDAEYALLTGRMECALQLAKHIQRKAVLRGQPCLVIGSYLIETKSLFYLGERQLEAKMQEFADFRQSLLRPSLVKSADIVYSSVYAALGEKEMMAGWVQNVEFDACNKAMENVRMGGVTYGMLLCREQKWMELDVIAEQLLAPFTKNEHIYAFIVGWIYKAIATCHLKGQVQATTYIKKALEIAKQDSVELPFIENGVELLQIADVLRVQDSFWEALLPKMQQYKSAYEKFRGVREEVILTSRETELLELVKDGLRNVDIGRRLGIAQVTVEKSLTAVYRKLGVANRAAAVAKWREINPKLNLK